MLASKVAVALLQMPEEHPATRAGDYAGWTVPLNYQPVHDLLKELHVGPYEQYGQITLADVWRKYWGWFVGSVLLVLMALTVALYVHRLNRRLGQATAELSTARDQLEERVKQRTQELEEAKEEAEQASRAKSAFLSSMSHELRTPLNAVLGFSQLMETDQVTPLTGTHLRNVQEISKAGKHLLELINDVLDLARIESGRLDLHPQPLSVVEQIDECFATLGPLADAHGVNLESEVDPASEDLVYADPTRFKQVLLNLLTNAIKYNRPGGRVVIRSEKPDAQWVRITVADTGIGIAENQMDALFEPFSRLATKEHVEGTGIGLTVTRQLVEAMGGSLGMRSTLGEGSEFWFLLPMPQ
jgi:signal transduction histidine kinase